MDFPNERYCRIYTRDTPDWLLLSWEARTLWLHLERKLDRSGVFEMGRHGLRGVSASLSLPLDLVERALPELFEAGPPYQIVQRGTVLVDPTYIEANEAPASGPQRMREHRERSRSERRMGALGLVTERNAPVTECIETVTAGDERLRAVTSGDSVPCRAVPCRAVPEDPVQTPSGPPAPPEAIEIAEAIVEHVRSLDAKAKSLRPGQLPKTMAAWSSSIRLLHEQDRRDWEEIRAVWEWTRADDFWRTVIRSGLNFREKFESLRVAKEQGRGRTRTRPAPVQRRLDEDWGRAGEKP